MTDPKDTTIEVLCDTVAAQWKEIFHLREADDRLRKANHEIALERDTYRAENEKLRAMIADFRGRLRQYGSPWAGSAEKELDDSEREAFGGGVS